MLPTLQTGENRDPFCENRRLDYGYRTLQGFVFRDAECRISMFGSEGRLPRAIKRLEAISLTLSRHVQSAYRGFTRTALPQELGAYGNAGELSGNNSV